MLCRVGVFLPHIPSEIVNFFIVHMNIIGNTHRFLRIEINIERLSISSKWIIFDQHIIKGIFLSFFPIIQSVRNGLLIFHIVYRLNLGLDLLLLLSKAAFCLRIHIS